MGNHADPLDFGLASNAEYLDQLYDRWKDDPDSVSGEMSAFFKGLEFASAGQGPAADNGLQSRVDSLVVHYRELGHRIAKIDPLEMQSSDSEMLSLDEHQLGVEHLDMTFDPYYFEGLGRTTLMEIITACEQTYASHLGVQYKHMSDTDERRWLQSIMEKCRNKPNLTKDEQKLLMYKIRQAEKFENYLQTKYRGQKRFSLEGGESLIGALDEIINQSLNDNVLELVFGMAHRGRLNVLANIMEKSLSMIFAEFEENYIPGSIFGDGDVKYHQGFSADVTKEDGKKIHISLAANPSHLEAVYPVVEGKVRAKQAYQKDFERKRIIPVILHGDAAFAGQGVVAESLQMSQLEGYKTGGTIHIIINNQVGFTTRPEDSRSSLYASDVAKIISCPIFHVNGDHPEAVIHAVRLAFEYRQKFGRDVVIDMLCYRRWGHNEGDEPTFTQPLMYDKIKDHPLVTEKYKNELIINGAFTKKEITDYIEQTDKNLEEEFTRALEISHLSIQIDLKSSLDGKWRGVNPRHLETKCETGVPYEKLLEVAEGVLNNPDGFNAHPKVKRIYKNRLKAVKEQGNIDWATAEMLALGTLMMEGCLVRLSGQDSRRGTFSQRHSAIYDTKTGERHLPLRNLKVDSERPLCWIFDSHLSEAAVLGFEYGYSLADPHRLCMWEAQFGDFANGAQVIIDQFISSSISKWGRYSGLVMLLPHGYEGQGPEHSSAKLERYLSLCAEENMQICYPTTPAQYFHALRRQIRRSFRRPLIVMAPKSILRNPMAVSPLSQLIDYRFHAILNDPNPPKEIKRLVLCSGKIYYDLEKQRREMDDCQTTLVRVELFYPFRDERWKEIADQHRNVDEIVWVQEESENMGAWRFMEPQLRRVFSKDIIYIGRDASASPAVASLKIHNYEQKGIIRKALDKKKLAPMEIGTGISIKYA